MSCCKSKKTVQTESQQDYSTAPKVKYSFKTNSPVVLSQESTYHTYHKNSPITISHQNHHMDSQEMQLEMQYQELLRQQRQLQNFYRNAIIPLENDVKYYEYQLEVRARELEQLRRLLRMVEEKRAKRYQHTVPYQNYQRSGNNMVSPVMVPMAYGM